MKKTGFLVLAIFSLLVAFALAIGSVAFLNATKSHNGPDTLTPHVLMVVGVTASVVVVVGCLFIFIAGLVSLRARQLPGTETILWVVLMLAFPVLGSIVYFIVAPRRQELSRPEYNL